MTNRLVLLLVVLLAGCAETDPSPEDCRVQRAVIDGKPCIIVSYGISSIRTTGIDCDWSKQPTGMTHGDPLKDMPEAEHASILRPSRWPSGVSVSCITSNTCVIGRPEDRVEQ